MARVLKHTVAVLLWWACYVPLNAFIFLVFLRLILTSKTKASVNTATAENDDAMIKAWVDANLNDGAGVNDDEGFGTRFERHMMAKLLLDLASRYGLKNVLEAPADGVTGIPGANSLPLAGVVDKPVALSNPSERLLKSAAGTWKARGLGNKVAIFPSPVNRLPMENSSYDLVWSFCMLERLREPAAYLAEASRVAGKTVLMVTLNRRNHGTWLHRIYHRVLGLEWDHGAFDMMTLTGIKKTFTKAGIEVIASGAVDVPPTWDTWDMPLGADISMITGLFGKKWEWKASSNNEKGFLLSLFEWIEDNLPLWFKLRNAHHLYVLGLAKNT